MRKKNDSSTDLEESDEAENDKIMREIAENYRNESDDLVDDDIDETVQQGADESTGDSRPGKSTLTQPNKLGKKNVKKH